MEFFSCDESDKDLDTQGGTLVLPVLSVAGVPQLSVDLLAYGSGQGEDNPTQTSLFTRVGYLETEYVQSVACVDPRAFDPSRGISNALEGKTGFFLLWDFWLISFELDHLSMLPN